MKRPPPSRPSRARDVAKMPELTADERVARIESMMLGGEWVAGASHAQLSREWGIGIAGIEKHASEAGRRIRRAVDPEAVTGAIIASVTAIGARAISGAKPDYRAALQALELKARLLGLITTKVEVSPLARLSDAELEAEIVKEANRIEAARALPEGNGKDHGDGNG